MRRTVTLLFLLATVALYAQKAKPVEIPLQDGEGIARGRLKGRQQMDYEVAASGQTLTVAMSAAPVRTLAIRVYDPDGAQMQLQKDGAGRWTTALSKSGGYGITVLRTNPSAVASRYRLKVTIR